MLRKIFSLFASKESLQRRNEQLRIAAMEGNLDKVKALLKGGAEIDGADGRKQTALHAAAQWGHPEVAKFLIDKGANPNVAPSGDLAGTPLTMAALNGHKDIVEMLVAAKADINATDYERRTAAHLAIQTGREDIALFLLEAGTDPDTQCRTGETPLLNAVQKDMHAAALMLAEHDASNVVHDADGCDARFLASQKNWTDVVFAIDNPGVAKRRAEERARAEQEAFDAAIKNAPVLQNDIQIMRPMALKPRPA